VENSFILAFLDIEGGPHSTSHDIQRLPNKMGLETHSSDRSALCFVVEKLHPHSGGEMLEGTVAKGCPHRGILLPLLCCLVVDKVIKRLDGNACYTLRYALSSSAESS